MAEPTTYVVLQRDETSGFWEFISKQEASNSEAAAKKAAAVGEIEGEFVAVPARSFQPLDIVFEANPRPVVRNRSSVAA